MPSREVHCNLRVFRNESLPMTTTLAEPARPTSRPQQLLDRLRAVVGDESLLFNLMFPSFLAVREPVWQGAAFRSAAE